MTHKDKTSYDSTPPCNINPYAGRRIKSATKSLKQTLDSRNFPLISETNSRFSQLNQDFVPRIENSENRDFVPRIENAENKFRESRLCFRDQRIRDFVSETKSRFSLDFRNWFSSKSRFSLDFRQVSIQSQIQNWIWDYVPRIETLFLKQSLESFELWSKVSILGTFSQNSQFLAFH